MSKAINYAVLRRDITYAVMKNPRLDKFAKYIFLALSAECHGLPYTTIDLESMAKNWDVSTSTVSRSIQLLEDEEFLIQSEYQGNRTKRKFMAKWLDSDLGISGYEAGGKSVTRQEDYLTYPEEIVADKEDRTVRRADYMADMLTSTTDMLTSTTDKVTGTADKATSTTDKVTGTADKATSTTDKVVAVSDSDESVSDGISSVGEGSNLVGDELIRKEEKKEIREDKKEKVVSISPSEFAKPKELLKSKLKSSQNWNNDELKHAQRMLDLLSGDTDLYLKLFDEVSSGNGYYNESKNDFEKNVEAVSGQKNSIETDSLRKQIEKVSETGINIPDELHGLSRKIWAYVFKYGDEVVKEALMHFAYQGRTKAIIDEDKMLNYINQNGERFN